LISAFFELRFWAEVASQWEKLSSIEVYQYLIGGKWDDKQSQMETASQMKRMGSRISVLSLIQRPSGNSHTFYKMENQNWV
jgi:hypothetical protein